ncbi:MAG: ERF family protein [Bacteroidales bacterium]
MKTSESIAKIAPALVKAQSEMSGAVKSANNPFFKSKYSDLNAVREACIPALAANGLSVLQPTVTIDGKSFVETIILHVSGEFIGGQTEIIAAKQNDAQSHGSGVSYARRYGLQALLCIGAEDDDGEKATDRTPRNTVVPPKIAQNLATNGTAHSVNSNQVAATSVTVTVTKPSVVAELQAAKPKTTSFKAAAEAKKQPVVVASSDDDLDL